MCFHRLPIELDADGRAHLKSGGWSSAEVPQGPSAPPPPPARPVHEFRAAPVTRVAGALEFFAQIDLANRRVHDARTSAVAFRGYEMVLKNRDPREAMDISSRVCGVCGGVHSTTSSMALDMALPVVPPPLGIVARNIAQAAELIYDHILHLCLLAGPDYSASLVERSEATLWPRAAAAAAPHAATHGFRTIADIMRALEPLVGSLYLEAFSRTRAGLDMVATMVGNYPHPTTMVPGGINVLLTEDSFRHVLRLCRDILDHVKKLILAYDDLMTFYEEARPAFVHNGERPISLLCMGRYDEPGSYDGTYARLDEWALRRAIPPGIILDGELRTTSLRTLNLGLEEFVDHSFYEHWSSHTLPTDPAGGPLSPFHPWNKETKPKPSGRDWKERYSWATAPRWDRQVIEAGPIARNWLLALAGRAELWQDRVQPTGDAVEFTLPQGAELPEMRFRWRVPQRLNTIERNRARAYHLGITWLEIVLECERALVLYGHGERRVWTRSSIPDEGVGAGFWEAARGALAHWVTIDKKLVANYQIITPSAFNASPRDPWGQPGPYEEAALNTPILEEFNSEEDFSGLDLMRAVRSFDPCMPCAVHMDTGHRSVLRNVVSCSCDAD